MTAAVRNLFRRFIAKETIRICGDAASATVERSIEVLKRKFHPGSATEFHERAARPRGSAQTLICFSFTMLASENPAQRRFLGSGREARERTLHAGQDFGCHGEFEMIGLEQ